jgi:hypothetical protein
MSDPKKPVPGDRTIDASDVPVVDFTPERIATLVKFREGVALAMANVLRLRPEDMERAGINEKDVERARTLIAERQRIEEVLPAAMKLAELLYETKLDKEHRISLIFGELAAQARRRAKRDPAGSEVLGPLADLLDYQSGPAMKAVATKEKAKLAKEAAEQTVPVTA